MTIGQMSQGPSDNDAQEEQRKAQRKAWEESVTLFFKETRKVDDIDDVEGPYFSMSLGTLVGGTPIIYLRDYARPMPRVDKTITLPFGSKSIPEILEICRQVADKVRNQQPYRNTQELQEFFTSIQALAS